MYNQTNLILKPSYRKRQSFYYPKARFQSTVQKGNIPKFYIRNTQSIDTIRVTKKVSRHHSSTYEYILRITKYKKEKEKEKKRQKINAIIKNFYLKKTPRDYYIGIINKIMSDKPNRIRSIFVELLDIIEYKELLSYYFSRGESVIKLSYLTKINAINVKVFPNYLKNEKIYSIMANYIKNKANLLNRIEKSQKIYELNMKLLKFIQNEKHIYYYEEDEKMKKNEIILKVMNTNNDNESFDIEDNLNYLNNNSFTNNKSNSINQIKKIIQDLSNCLKNNNSNNTNNNKDINKNSKNNLKLINNNNNNKDINENNKDNLKLINNSDNNEDINTNSNNNLKLINNNNKRNNIRLITNIKDEKELYVTKKDKNAYFSDLFTSKQKKLQLTTINNNKNKRSLKKNSRTFKHIQIDSEGIPKNRTNLVLNSITHSNRHSRNNNLFLNTITNYSKTRDLISTENKNSKSLPIHKKFKSTNKFLLKNNQEKENQKIKKTIINIIKKFGKIRYKDNIDELSSQAMDILIKHKNLFSNNEYNNNILNKNPGNSNSNYFNNLFSTIKIKNNFFPLKTQRIELNIIKYLNKKTHSFGDKNNMNKIKIKHDKINNFIKKKTAKYKPIKIL